MRKTATVYAIDKKGNSFRVAGYDLKTALRVVDDETVKNICGATELIAVDGSGKIIARTKKHTPSDNVEPIRFKFIKNPGTFYTDPTGAIYEQVTPFERVERDWNNGGDIYYMTVSVFVLIGDERPNRFAVLPKKITVDCDEYGDYIRGNIIDFI